MDVGGVVVGNYLLHQYLEERKKLLGLKENRNRLLEQKVRTDRSCTCISGLSIYVT